MKRVLFALLLIASTTLVYADEPRFDSYGDSLLLEKSWYILRTSDDESALRKAYESILFQACFDNRLTPKACGYLGVCHKYGWYGKDDMKIANEYFEKGAKKGDKICLDELGNSYLYGLGVEENIPKAIELLSQAAKEDPTCYGTLGEAYLKANDSKNALMWLEKGIQEHCENAYYTLINYYLDMYQSERAYSYLTKAMDDVDTGLLKNVYGERYARFDVLMGMFYESGLPPVHKDIARARYWFTQAANKGDNWASRKLLQL